MSLRKCAQKWLPNLCQKSAPENTIFCKLSWRQSVSLSNMWQSLKKISLVLSLLDPQLGIGVVTKRSIVKWKRQVVGQASSWERACSKPVNSYLQSTHKSIIRPKAAAKNGPTKKGQDWKWLNSASAKRELRLYNFDVFNYFCLIRYWSGW